MKAILFLAALSAAVFAFELLEGLLSTGPVPGRLQGVAAGALERPHHRRSTWFAILIVFFPGYFQPEHRGSKFDIADLLRRSGYPYATVGEFYAAAARTFSFYLVWGALAAGAIVSADAGLLPGVGVAAIFVLLGLRRPYSRLKKKIRLRAVALRNNMLTGLSVLNALLSAGVGVQESLRRTAAVGGPFCNLLGLLVAQMEVSPFEKAVEITEIHLPDAGDVEAQLFLRAVREFYNRNRPLLPAVTGLQAAVHRDVLESTESRAALVRQRSGLFGVLAVLGLVITIIAPFLNVFA